MKSARTSTLLLLALLVLCFGLGAALVTRMQGLEKSVHQSNNFFVRLLGDASQLFSNSAFVEADSYYHSGYYPTIFDDKSGFKTLHIAEDTGNVASHNVGGEDTSFLGPPRDWIDAFGRHFIPNRHTHLDEGGAADDLSGSKEVEEILPWLKLSIELNPKAIKTYVVTAYWLTRLHQTNTAQQVLLEGLQNNPQNTELLFELGRIYFEECHDMARARNVWQAALKSWERQEPGVPLSDRLKQTSENFDSRFMFEQIQTRLAQLEEQAGNYGAALDHWNQVKLASANAAGVQRQIDEIREKMKKPVP